MEASNIVSESYAKTANMAGQKLRSIFSITYIITIKGYYIATIIPHMLSSSFYLGASDNKLAVRPKP